MTGRLPPAADGMVDPHMSAAIARAYERAATRITAPVPVAAPGRAAGNRIVLETGVTLATGARAKSSERLMPTDRRRTEQAHGALVRQLALTAHPEGGHYRETTRLPAGADGRSRMTAILFLLNAGEQSHWHRVDADELWLWHAGSPLTLRIGTGQAVLGCDVLAGEQVQALVPAGTWQSARADSGWALVSCVVSPGFEFDGFELAPPDWSPELP